MKIKKSNNIFSKKNLALALGITISIGLGFGLTHLIKNNRYAENLNKKIEYNTNETINSYQNYGRQFKNSENSTQTYKK